MAVGYSSIESSDDADAGETFVSHLLAGLKETPEQMDNRMDSSIQYQVELTLIC